MQEEGHKKLFKLSLSQTESASAAASIDQVTASHSVTSYSVLPTTFVAGKKHEEPCRLLVTMNSFTSPNETFLVSAEGKGAVSVSQLSNISTDLLGHLGLDKSEEFWFSGCDPDVQVHGFLLRPPNFDKKKKHPLAFLVHGGPQSAWTDSWSTRWNPNAFTAQGYVVVAINPTGSTGYGQDFTDAINQQWGGKPFKVECPGMILHRQLTSPQDLVAGLDFVKRIYGDFIDTERMAMLGRSAYPVHQYMLKFL